VNLESNNSSFFIRKYFYQLQRRQARWPIRIQRISPCLFCY